MTDVAAPPPPPPTPAPEEGPWNEAASHLVSRAVDAAERGVDAARSAWEGLVDFAIDILAETLPQAIRRLTLFLVGFGIVAGGMGVLALADPDLFLRVLVYLFGLVLVMLAALSLYLAFKLQEATATLRTLGRLAARWRARRERRRELTPEAP